MFKARPRLIIAITFNQCARDREHGRFCLVIGCAALRRAIMARRKVLLVLLTWALGGAAPTRRAALLMGLIMCGLVFALDVPERLSNQGTQGRDDRQAGAGPWWHSFSR